MLNDSLVTRLKNTSGLPQGSYGSINASNTFWSSLIHSGIYSVYNMIDAPNDYKSGTLIVGGNNESYYTQIWIPYDGSGIYLNSVNGGTSSGWIKIS